MPCIAVSARCASSASQLGQGRRDRGRRCRPPWRSPSACGFSAPTGRCAQLVGARAANRCRGRTGSKAAASRPQIAPALAVESCCDTTIAASPAKPPARRRSGGRPALASTGAMRGSAATSGCKAGVEIGFGVDEMGHAVSVVIAGIGAAIHAGGCFIRERWTRRSRPVATKIPPVFRFAPSPNGHLHLGHALSALLEFRYGARRRRQVPAAHRGHRHRALPAGIRGGDL